MTAPLRADPARRRRAAAAAGRRRVAETMLRRAERIVEARYDAAQTNPDNRRHWSQADSLSANAANSPEVRRVLRARARYEVANNSYARGAVLSIAQDMIGSGPKLQVQTTNPAFNAALEGVWERWAREVRLAAALRTMRAARVVDGEAFGVLTTNRRMRGPLKLFLRVIEADRVANPAGVAEDPGADTLDVDGVRVDRDTGQPVSYLVAKSHPGDLGFVRSGEFREIDAASVVHWFRQDRPEQCRGVPEITPALPLFGMLRRYNLSVLAAAETAADHAAVLYTDAPASGQADSYEDIPPEIEIERRMMTLLPAGWKMGQMKAEQPATTHETTVRVYLREAARCLCIPACVMLGDSSGYNYASGRLDKQTYRRMHAVDQSDGELVVLDVLFEAVTDEAMLVPGLLPEVGPLAEIPHLWTWDADEHVDPVKEATAQAIRLKSLATTHAWEWAKQNRDYEEGFKQIAKEHRLMRKLGILPADLQPAPVPAPAPAADPLDPEDEDE